MSLTIGSGVTSIGSKTFGSCKELTDVYCWAEHAPMVKEEWGTPCTDAFEDSYIEYATLHVPAESVEEYKAMEPWKNFGSIATLSGEGLPPAPDPEKCATPTIEFANGELTFSCETEDVEYVAEVKADEARKYFESKVKLDGKYIVSVYAMKDGYVNSDVATAIIYPGQNPTVKTVCDVNRDGTVDVADISAIITAMAE
jgi:hypothetical protein